MYHVSIAAEKTITKFKDAAQWWLTVIAYIISGQLRNLLKFAWAGKLSRTIIFKVSPFLLPVTNMIAHKKWLSFADNWKKKSTEE